MPNIYGICSGLAGLAYTTWLECTSTEDVANNLSHISIALKVKRTDGSMGGYQWTDTTAGRGDTEIKLGNGTTIVPAGYTNSLGITIDLRNQNIVTLLTETWDVSHESDGTLSLILNSVWDTNGHSTYLTGGTISGTWTLPTIPRASTPSINNFTIGNAAVAIVINRASTGFTHTIKYKFATQSSFTTIATGVESSFNWDTSAIKTTLYALIPNALSDTITILCDTYSGSTLIGSKTTTCTASVDTADSAPTVSATAADSNATVTTLTGNNQVFVKNNSNALITPTVAAKNSASIASYFVVIGSKTYSNASVPASHTVNGVDSGTITIIVTDSRGLTTTFVLTKTIIMYGAVVIGACLLNRDTPVSNVVKITSMANSSYWIGNFGAMANVLTLEYRWRIAGGTWSSYIPLASGFATYTFTGTFSALNIYEFEVRATDKLTTVTVAKTILTGTPLIDIGETDVKINGAFEIKANPLTAAASNYYVDTGDGLLKQKSLSAAKAELSTVPSASELLTAIKTVDGAGSGLDACLVDGFQTFSGGIGGMWPYIPVVKADGVMEVGAHIDMHAVTNDGVDYSVRLQTTGLGYLYMNGYRVWSQNMVDFATGQGTYNSNTWVAVSFGKTFPGIPRVQLTPNSTVAGVLAPKMKNVSTTGFEAVMGGSVGTVVCDWVALWK